MLALPLNAAKTELTARIATRRIAIVFFIIPPEIHVKGIWHIGSFSNLGIWFIV